MRLYLKTTPNKKIIPYAYQQHVVGAFHKWLGKNDVHDHLSLYSLSWLSGGKGQKEGLNFPNGSTFFISSPDTDLIKRVIAGIKSDPVIDFGLKVKELMIKQCPTFRETESFFLNSPVLIKRTYEGKVKYFFPPNELCDVLVTETLKHKLKKAGKGTLSIQAHFDKSYTQAKTTLVDYKGIKNKATFCPVALEGDPEAIAFAWEVGIGNSTGIGFGAIK